jgi:hypothetical protein
MTEVRPGHDYDARLVEAVALQSRAIDALLERERGSEVYGVTTWEPSPGQPAVAIFGAARDGLSGYFHYDLKVFDDLSGRVSGANYRGLTWVTRWHDPDPDTLKRHRHNSGTWRSVPLPSPERIAPFLTLDLAAAQCFNPDTHTVRLKDGSATIVRRAWYRGLARSLGKVTGLGG